MASGPAPSPTLQDPAGGWRVIHAAFIKSGAGLGDAPAGERPEVAVCGRSNVGKSSLLNRFANQRGLARVSRTPGRTRLLNFFALTLAARERRFELGWVDLPGYGYAAAPRSIRDGFGPMIEGFLMGRPQLGALLVLLDARRPVSGADRLLLDFARERRLAALLCVTKVDKLAATERGAVLRGLAEQLGVEPASLLATSAQTGLGLGPPRHLLARAIVRALEPGPSRGPEGP